MDASPTFTADVAGLVYVAGDAHGIRRVRQGQHFEYVTESGKRITSEAVLDRIRKLAIPPAYESVWICMNPRGHLQATGRDARGRKQYRYHALWRTARDGVKFGRMAAFGAALPALRRRLRRDLDEPALSRVKVVAAVVSLLDATLVRIGNDEYARSNHSFGLTTLRNRHVRFIRDGQLRLSFRGKGGVPHEIEIDDARLARIVRRCHQLPGQRLFQFVDADGSQHPVDSDQVNAYLREVTGADFTAKDFRTWGATTRAIELLARTPLTGRSQRACLQGLRTCRRAGSRPRIAQHAGGVPALLHQPRRLRGVALRTAARGGFHANARRRPHWRALHARVAAAGAASIAPALSWARGLKPGSSTRRVAPAFRARDCR